MIIPEKWFFDIFLLVIATEARTVSIYFTSAGSSRYTTLNLSMIWRNSNYKSFKQAALIATWVPARFFPKRTNSQTALDNIYTCKLYLSHGILVMFLYYAIIIWGG